MFEVVGVFPDVDSVDQGGGFHQRRILVGVGLNEKFAFFVSGKPSPTAAKYSHGGFGHLFFPLFVVSKCVVDLLG